MPLGLAWHGLAWLGLAWNGLDWIGLALAAGIVTGDDLDAVRVATATARSKLLVRELVKGLNI